MNNQNITEFIKEKLAQIQHSTSAHVIKQHSGINNIYLGTSDWTVVQNLEIFLKKVKQSDILLICGLAGLNFIEKTKSSKIIFLDINKYSLIYYLYISCLIIISNSRAEFISYLYSKNREKIESLLSEKNYSDIEFNKILPDFDTFLNQNNYLKNMHFSDEMLKYKEALFNAKILTESIIPSEPFDQKRELYLFKCDFDRIYNPHPISIFMNSGWLNSEECFINTKNIILKSDFEFINFNLVSDLLLDIFNNDENKKDISLFISNIGSTISLEEQRLSLFENNIIPKLENKIKNETLITYYKRVLYQFFVLYNFLNSLLTLNNITLITQFGVFDKDELLLLKKEFLD